MRTVKKWHGFLMILSIVAACGGLMAIGGAVAQDIPRGNVNVRLHDKVLGNIAMLNPTGNHASILISTATYDRLVGYSPDGKKVVPWVATEWKETPTTVTLTIRRGITCSDGTPLTPSAIANWLTRIVDPVKHGLASFALSGMGPGPFSVSADDAAGTVTLTSGTPNSELLGSLARPHLGIVCPAGFQPGADFNKSAYGTGRFTLESVTADTVTVKRRLDWTWGPNNATANDPGIPDTITFKVVENETTAANLLVTGQLDLADITSGADAKRLRQNKELTETFTFATLPETMVFNVASGRLTADKAVRQALATAIDPNAWLVAAHGGEGKVQTSVVSDGVPCYDPGTAKILPQTPGDVGKARSMLLAAGWTLGADGKLQKDGKPLRLEILSTQLVGAGPEYVAEQFNKVGATAVLVPGTFQEMQQGRNGNFDITFNGGGGSAPAMGTAPTFYTGPVPPAGRNVSAIKDPVVDDLRNKAYGTLGCDAWFEWQRRVVSEAYVLPLMSLKYSYFSRSLAPVIILGNYPSAESIRRVR